MKKRFNIITSRGLLTLVGKGHSRRHSRFAIGSALALATLACLTAASGAQAQSITNGNFETGDLTGYTVFTTSNGTNGVGVPDVVLFDVLPGSPSNAAHFQVGQSTFTGPPNEEGGGLYQNIFFASDSLATFSADVAVVNSTNNADDGTLELLIDNTVLTSFAFGSVNGVSRTHLSGSLNVSAGTHQFNLEALRTYQSSGIAGQTPEQYFDNVTLVAVPIAVPEPGSIALLVGMGASGADFLVRRRKQARKAGQGGCKLFLISL